MNARPEWVTGPGIELQDALDAQELADLATYCQWVAGLGLEPELRLHAASIEAWHSDDWRDLFATAMATGPEVVESMLLGGPPIPGSIERLRAFRQVWPKGEIEARAAEHRAQDRRRAQERARSRARRHVGLPPLPERWWEQASTVAVVQVAGRLGMQARHGRWGPCPCCGEERTSRKDRRPPLHLAEKWKCWACGVHGDAIDMVCGTLFGRIRWAGREEREQVGQWFVGQGLV